MGITIYGTDGELETLDGGPYQYTPEGLPTGLSTNSRPLAEWNASKSFFLRMYHEQPWVKICVDKLTHQIARLPLKVYAGDPFAKERVTEGPLVGAIRRPAPRCGPINLKQWLVKSTLIFGASAVHLRRNRAGGTPVGFRRLLWQYLEPRRENDAPDGEILYWVYRPPRQAPEILLPPDVLIVAWESVDGQTIGVSPLRPLGLTLAIETAAQRYQERLLRNSTRPPGGVAWSDKNDRLVELAADPAFRRQFEEELARLMGGEFNAGKPLLLPPGATWQSFAYSAQEAEIIAQRKLTREEVGASYDMAPPLIGVLEGTNDAGIQALLPALYTNTLPPWLSLTADAFNAQVVDPEPAFEGQWVEYDLSDATRGDPVKEATALKTTLMIGLRTINEGRAKLNLAPIDHPDANRPLIPVNNMIFLGGTPLRDPAGEEEPGDSNELKALLDNIGRAGDRVYRRMKAGDANAWDPDRFERELSTDLEAAGANGTAARTAKAWTGAFTALLSDAQGDAEAFRTNFEALTPPPNPS